MGDNSIVFFLPVRCGKETKTSKSLLRGVKLICVKCVEVSDPQT